MFTENGLLASPKGTDGSEPRDSLPPLEAREVLSSSSSSTPDYMPAEFMAHASSGASYAQDRSPANALGSLDSIHGFDGYPSASTTIAVAHGTPPPSPPCDRIKSPVKLEPLHMAQGLYALPASPLSGYNIPSTADASPIYPMIPSPNRLLSLCLWAEGMSMFIADVDVIASSLAMPMADDGSSMVLLHVKIAIPAADDLYSPPNLHGFHGVATFASQWATQAWCNTHVYSGRACVSQEPALLDSLQTAHIHPPAGLTPQSVSFNLPESSLTRCRWLPNSTSPNPSLSAPRPPRGG